MYEILIGSLGIILLVSFLLAPRVRTTDGFFRGFAENGAAPSLITLTLSQVTTWVFARSLMNAAILGFYYGIAGTVAYAAYYLSFLTGAWIVDGIRFRHGYASKGLARITLSWRCVCSVRCSPICWWSASYSAFRARFPIPSPSSPSRF